MTSYHTTVTSPRSNPRRELFGIIGAAVDAKGEQGWWNAEFLRLGADAFMDYYPTKEDRLAERLSEMFHFDRRGYIVGTLLQEAIIPLLDRLDSSVPGEGRVNTVLNESGVLTGYVCDDRNSRQLLWLGQGSRR